MARSNGILILALIGAVAWRLGRWWLGFPLFGDEAFMARTFQHVGPTNLSELAGELRHQMVAPYGYLLLTWKTAQTWGLDERVLRFWSSLAGLAGLLIFVRIFFRQLEANAARLASGILLASYYPVRHACEVKPYAFDFLASAVVLAGALSLLSSPSARWRSVCFGILASLAVLLSYPVAFTLFGVGMVAIPYLLRTDRSAAIRLGAGLVASFAVFMTLYWFVSRHQQWDASTIDGGQWEDDFPPRSPLAWPLWLLRALGGNMLAYPNGGSFPGSLGTLALVLLGLGALLRSGHRQLALLLVAPLVPMLVASSAHLYPFGGSARVNLHLAGPICLLAGVGLERLLRLLSERLQCWTRDGLLMLLALVPFLMLFQDVRRPYKSISDLACRDFVRRLVAEAPADQSWFVLGGLEADDQAQLDWFSYGGSAARLAFYLDREAPGRIHWGAPIDIKELSVPLLVYTDNKHSSQESQITVERILEKRPAREVEFTSFEPGRTPPRTKEGITIYRF